MSHLDDYSDVWAEIHSYRETEVAHEGFELAGADTDLPPEAAGEGWSTGLISVPLEDGETPPAFSLTNPRISERLDLEAGRIVFTVLCDDGQDVEIKALVAKLNKKLAKWEQVIQITGEEEVLKQHWLSRGFIGREVGKSVEFDAHRAARGARQTTVRQVKLTIESPAVAGKTAKLIGSFELAEDGKSVYRHALNGATPADLEPFLPRWQDCDHCGFKRDRRASFVCETTEGERLVIGRQCSRDFLGLDAAELLARDAVAKVLSQGGVGEEGSAGGGTNYFHVETLVKRAYLVAKRLGGYSRDTADTFRLHVAALEGAKDWDKSTIFRDLRAAYAEWLEKAQPEPLDLEALADYVYGATGDFGDNLRIAFGCEYAKHKRRGLILAGTGLYVGRALKVQAEAVVAAVKPAPRHLAGAVGARVDFEATVEKVIPLSSDYGIKRLIKMVGDDGARVAHFCTAEVAPEAGKRYAVRGTIKAHEDGRFGKQTVVTRAAYTAA